MNCTEIFQDAKKNVFVEKSIIGNTFILYRTRRNLTGDEISWIASLYNARY